MTPLPADLEALMPKPAVRCGDYAGPPGEGASEDYYDADQVREAMLAAHISALDDAYNAMFDLGGDKVTRFDAQTAIRKLRDAQALDGEAGEPT